METKRLARRAAQIAAPVLLRGETGTGKELIAHAIHAGGPRAERPFVPVNVAAIPDTLLEAEFFGVAPGAYTGAERKARPGKLELADGGTLFLDEIGDMPLALQAKLLRVLQDQEFEALGSNRVHRVDVRVITATSRDLEAMVRDGAFRKDLFYRLNVLNIPIPALRDRIGDLEHALRAPAGEDRPPATALRAGTWPPGPGAPAPPPLARERAGTGERPGAGHARHGRPHPGSGRTCARSCPEAGKPATNSPPSPAPWRRRGTGPWKRPWPPAAATGPRRRGGWASAGPPCTRRLERLGKKP